MLTERAEMSDDITDDDIPSFRGSGPDDCDIFIQAVRRQGHREGKLRDDQYMADLASLYLSGPALRWHRRLDKDTRDSWDALETALLEEYGDEAAPAAGGPPNIAYAALR